MFSLDDGVALVDTFYILLVSNRFLRLEPFFNFLRVLLDIFIVGLSLLLKQLFLGFLFSLNLLFQVLLIGDLPLFFNLKNFSVWSDFDGRVNGNQPGIILQCVVTHGPVHPVSLSFS